MKEVVLDALLGGLILGTISYMSNTYGDKHPNFYKILAFLWTIPFTFFLFINMASRNSKQSVYDFSKHSLIGTGLTFVLALITMYIIDYNVYTIIAFAFFFSIVFTILYLALEIYKY